MQFFRTLIFFEVQNNHQQALSHIWPYVRLFCSNFLRSIEPLRCPSVHQNRFSGVKAWGNSGQARAKILAFTSIIEESEIIEVIVWYLSDNVFRS